MEKPTDLAAGARSILDAATEAFANAGYDSVSIADIAGQAGVSKANIFHHFKCKETLYEEVLREACKGHAEFTEGLLAREDLSSVDKIRALIHFDFRNAFSQIERSHLVVREILNTGCDTGRGLVEPVFLRNFAAVIGLVEQGRQRGEFRAEIDAPMTAMMIGGTVILLFQNRRILDSFPGLGGNACPDDYAEMVCRTLLGGLIRSDAAAVSAPPTNTP